MDHQPHELGDLPCAVLRRDGKGQVARDHLDGVRKFSRRGRRFCGDGRLMIRGYDLPRVGHVDRKPPLGISHRMQRDSLSAARDGRRQEATDARDGRHQESTHAHDGQQGKSGRAAG